MSASSEQSEIQIDRQERLMQTLAYNNLRNGMFTFLLVNIQLVLLKEADMLFPFKTIVAFGFLYWTICSIASIYYHFTEKRFNSPVLFSVKILSVVASIGTMSYALPPIFQLEAIVYLNPPIESPILLAFAVGILSQVIGLFVSSFRARGGARTN